MITISIICDCDELKKKKSVRIKSSKLVIFKTVISRNSVNFEILLYDVNIFPIYVLLFLVLSPGQPSLPRRFVG